MRTPACCCAAATAVAVLCGAAATPATALPRPPFVLTGAQGAWYPVVAAGPGRTVHVTVRVRSRTSRPLVVRLQAADVVTARRGGPLFRTAAPRGPGRWLDLPTRDVRLPGGAARTVHLTLRVPGDATPGSHYAGVVGVDRRTLRRTVPAPSAPASGVPVRRLTRVALPVHVILPGRAVRRLALGKVSFAADVTGSRVDVGLRNTGNLLVGRTAVDLRIAGDGRWFGHHRAQLAGILPGTGATHAVSWRGTPPVPGTYWVTGTITPSGAPAIRVQQPVSFGAGDLAELRRLTGVAPPAGPLRRLGPPAGLAVLAAVLATGALVAVPRRRRPRRDARAVRLGAAPGAAGGWEWAVDDLPVDLPRDVGLELGRGGPARETVRA